MQYTSVAIAPNGQLWWELRVRPGTRRARFGDEQRIAAWLACNKEVGELFTTEDIRENVRDLDTGGRNVHEHVQRRLRELRHRDSWKIPSNKYVKSIPNGSYRLDEVGWHPGLGVPRAKKWNLSAKTRRAVIVRDGGRCQICGVGHNEPYPENADQLAVMTAGHVVARSLGGSDDLGNLRAECALCNEGSRAATGRPMVFDDVLERVRDLGADKRRRFALWAHAGARVRDDLDEAYDNYRALSLSDRDRVLGELEVRDLI